ncbi:MAG: glutamine amidotransferase [Bacillota bacterium]
MKTLLAVRHVLFEDLGSFALILAEAGYGIRYAEASTADFAALGKENWDLLVVLGGPIGVNDAADYPFLAPELKFIEARLKGGGATLGLCLGSQFIAKALGAQVYKGKQVEIGWKAVTLTDAGRKSCLRHFTAPVFHWHGETYDLPKDAVALASTDLYPQQGFSWGRALALQFHPEVTAKGLEQWWVGNVGELRELGLTPGALRVESQKRSPAMEKEAATMLKEWLRSFD